MAVRATAGKVKRVCLWCGYLIGFDIYVREDKFVLGKARLVELAQKLSQQSGLKHPMVVKKGDMLPLHQLLFWFVI